MMQPECLLRHIAAHLMNDQIRRGLDQALQQNKEHRNEFVQGL